MFCFPRETVKLLPPCDNLGGTFVGITPLDRDLRSDFHHPSRRDLEIIRGVVGGAAEADEQQVLPARHARMCRGLEQVADRSRSSERSTGKAASVVPAR